MVHRRLPVCWSFGGNLFSVTLLLKCFLLPSSTSLTFFYPFPLSLVPLLTFLLFISLASLLSLIDFFFFCQLFLQLYRKLKFGKPGGPFLSLCHSWVTLGRGDGASCNLFASKFPYWRDRGGQYLSISHLLTAYWAAQRGNT